MKLNINDGGRKAAGYKGDGRDCVARAIAIATGRGYQEVCDGLNELAKVERRGKRKKGISKANTGVYMQTATKYLKLMGWEFVATMGIGTGCRVHMRADELPRGVIICRVSHHFVAVIGGVMQDTHDCSRGGKRAVYGYFIHGDLV